MRLVATGPSRRRGVSGSYARLGLAQVLARHQTDQRVRQILSLWTKDAVLQLNTGSPFDGYYIGRGTQGDSSTCPMPSNNLANQGTLCPLYTYVAGSFQPANKFISLGF